MMALTHRPSTLNRARLNAKASAPAVRRASRATFCRVRAEATAPKPAHDKFFDSIGQGPTEEGYFGFKPFAETWVGRWAMLGFVSSIVGEFTTGRGTLGQLGLETPSTPVLIALSVFFGGATIAGAVSTVQQLAAKKMPRASLERYKNFLGLNNDKDWMSEQAKMKGKADPNAAAPAATSAEVPQASAAVSAPEASTPAAATTSAPPPLPQPSTPAQRRANANNAIMDDMAYARNIELSNGRAAMMGFLIAVLVEAGTGNGILGQLIMWFKACGLLGTDSGF